LLSWRMSLTYSQYKLMLMAEAGSHLAITSLGGQMWIDGSLGVETCMFWTARYLRRCYEDHFERFRFWGKRKTPLCIYTPGFSLQLRPLKQDLSKAGVQCQTFVFVSVSLPRYEHRCPAC